MRQQGTLCKWNEERGFGFIKPFAGGEDIFVHISAFPKHIVQPTIGEPVYYRIATRSGKPQAIDVQTQQSGQSRHMSARRDAGKNTNPLGKFVLLTLLFVLIAIVYMKFFNRPQNVTPDTASASTTGAQRSDAEIRQAIRESLNQSGNSRPQSIITSKAPTSSGFTCDGRTLCSQMTSCAEATYFLQNCPGVKMDGGDGQGRPDGVPCEAQLCGE